jgi:hypothetical protein
MANAEPGDEYRRILEAARRVAHEDWWHLHVGTEHLLLAVLEDVTGPLANLFCGSDAAPTS